MNDLSVTLTPYLGYITLAAVVALALSVFKPGRILLGLVFKLFFKIVGMIFSTLSSFFHKFGISILRAHGVLFRNYFPRNSVMPTVAVKTTRRT